MAAGLLAPCSLQISAMPIAPLCRNLLVRIDAWILILGGRLSQTLLALIGIQPVRLIDTPTAQVIDIVFADPPRLTFPMSGSLERLNERMAALSGGLGAAPVRTVPQVSLRFSTLDIAPGCTHARRQTPDGRFSGPDGFFGRPGLRFWQIPAEAVPGLAKRAGLLGRCHNACGYRACGHGVFRQRAFDCAAYARPAYLRRHLHALCDARFGAAQRILNCWRRDQHLRDSDRSASWFSRRGRCAFWRQIGPVGPLLSKQTLRGWCDRFRWPGFLGTASHRPLDRWAGVRLAGPSRAH